MRPLGDPGAPLGLWAPRKILGCHLLSTALYRILLIGSLPYIIFFHFNLLQ